MEEQSGEGEEKMDDCATKRATRRRRVYKSEGKESKKSSKKKRKRGRAKKGHDRETDECEMARSGLPRLRMQGNKHDAASFQQMLIEIKKGNQNDDEEWEEKEIRQQPTILRQRKPTVR